MQVSEFALGMTGTCTGCGRPLRVGPENTAPLEPAPPSTASTSAPGTPAAPPASCARCGRAFRGDWDRYSRAGGLFCHICANLSDQRAAADTSPAPVASPENPNALDAVADEDNEGQALSWGDKFAEFRETRAFRRGLWIAAFSVIGLAIAVSFMDTPEPAVAPQESAEISVWNAVENLSPAQARWFGWVMAATNWGFMWLRTFFALYIALAMAGKLPGYQWFGSAVHVGVVSLVMTGIALAMSIGLGFFLGFLGGLLGFVVIIYVFFTVYDAGLTDIVTFAVFRFLFGILFSMLQMLILGGLALILL